MNFIVFTSSGSLVTIGPCSYYLARRETTFDSMLYPILAKREVSIARILAIWKPRNSPYTVNTLSQTGNLHELGPADSVIKPFEKFRGVFGIRRYYITRKS